MPLPPLILGRRTWDWSRPYLLGIVNVTPDSFSDGGRHDTFDAALRHALALVDEGADALDLGGESTRPGAAAVSADDELSRVLPLVEALAKRDIVPLSVDTTKAAVADRCLAAGAVVLNDVGMGDDRAALGATAGRHHAAYLLMHARGTPSTMRALTAYERVGDDVARELREGVRAVEAAGVAPGRVLVDPGIGFAKTALQSLSLLSNLAPVMALGYPVCVGPSRKSFIAAADAYSPSWAMRASTPSDRLGGTAAAVTAAVLQGAHVLRVHDVAVMREAARVAHALRGAP